MLRLNRSRSTRKLLVFIGAFSISLLLLASCGQEKETDSRLDGSVYRSYLWRVSGHKIPYCFLNGSNGQKQTVQNLIRGQLNARTNLDLIHYSNCSNLGSNKAIRIRFMDGKPRGMSKIGPSDPWPVNTMLSINMNGQTDSFRKCDLACYQ